jgi:hypothetical protein
VLAGEPNSRQRGRSNQNNEHRRHFTHRALHMAQVKKPNVILSVIRLEKDQ